MTTTEDTSESPPWVPSQASLDRLQLEVIDNLETHYDELTQLRREYIALAREALAMLPTIQAFGERWKAADDRLNAVWPSYQLADESWRDLDREQRSTLFQDPGTWPGSYEEKATSEFLAPSGWEVASAVVSQIVNTLVAHGIDETSTDAAEAIEGLDQLERRAGEES